MLHWMLLTLSTLMPSLEANIVGGCRLTGAISMIHAFISHAFINASMQTASQMDSTPELTAPVCAPCGARRTIAHLQQQVARRIADGAPHHCAPAAAGASCIRWRTTSLMARRMIARL